MSRRPPHRLWAIGAIIIGLIVVTLILATVLLEGPLKRYAEDQADQRLGIMRFRSVPFTCTRSGWR